MFEPIMVAAILSIAIALAIDHLHGFHDPGNYVHISMMEIGDPARSALDEATRSSGASVCTQPRAPEVSPPAMLTRRDFLTASTAAAALTATPSGARAQSPRRRDAVPPTSPSPVT